MRAFVLTFLGTTAVWGAACSLNELSSQYGQDGGGLPDAGTGPRDASFCADKDAYCFDFDERASPAEYFTNPDPKHGKVVFDESAAVSPPRSLSVTLLPDAGKTSYSVMSNRYGRNPTEITYEVNFQVAQAPIPAEDHPKGADGIFATILKITFDKGAPEERDLAIHVRGQDNSYLVYAYEHGHNVADGGGPGFHDLAPLGTFPETRAPTSWSRLILRVRTTPVLSVSAQLNENNEKPLKMIEGWRVVDPYFFVGINYAQPLSTSPWTIRYDNVRIDLKGSAP